MRELLLLNAGERRAGLLTIRGGGHAEAIAAQPSAVASHARDEHVGGVALRACVEGHLIGDAA